MSDRDPTLDMALRLLQNENAADEDARWAKRVAAGISTWTGKTASRGELDALLASPLPDDHRDQAVNDEHLAADDLEDADAAHAVHDAGDDQATPGWDSISHPPASGRVSASEGLARLTRSGPNPSASSLAATDVGAAKADDSGLIDLRGLSKSGEQAATPVAADEPAPMAIVATASNVTPIAKAAASRPLVASPPVAAMSAAAAGSAPVALATKPATPEKKKGGAAIWMIGGGLVAAAAAAFLFVNMGNKAPEPSSAAQEKSKSAKSDDDQAASASAVAKPAATVAAVPTENVAASASASVDDPPVLDPEPDPKIAVAPKYPMGAKTQPGTPTAALTGTAAPTGKPTAKPSAEPTTAKPPPGGGSLDDVLGINKPGPATTATAVTPDLPDKPESVDIRVAVNGKVPVANACVSGLDGPSTVSITFGPAGTVTSVSVTSGPAKGTGAESCIKSAFSSAKVGRSKLGGTGAAKLMPAGGK